MESLSIHNRARCKCFGIVLVALLVSSCGKQPANPPVPIPNAPSASPTQSTHEIKIPPSHGDILFNIQLRKRPGLNTEADKWYGPMDIFAVYEDADGNPARLLVVQVEGARIFKTKENNYAELVLPRGSAQIARHLGALHRSQKVQFEIALSNAKNVQFLDKINPKADEVFRKQLRSLE